MAAQVPAVSNYLLGSGGGDQSCTELLVPSLVYFSSGIKRTVTERCFRKNNFSLSINCKQRPSFSSNESC